MWISAARAVLAYACPTGALDVPYEIDPRRCISYLTIEHKGSIPDELAVAMGNHIYGCDDCLDACPWNKFSVINKEDSDREDNGLEDEDLPNDKLEVSEE